MGVTLHTSDGWPSADLLCPGVGRGPDDGHALVPPLVQTTTFVRRGIESKATHQYSRVSNPTVSALEEALGSLEGTLPAACFTTGLAAETALFLALLRSGDHVICGRSVYGGTTRLLRDILQPLGVRCSFVDATRPEQIAAAINEHTKLVFVETPANPTLEITDIRACREAIRGSNAILAVDNTFLTGALQRPLDHGADVSVYSTTKFIDGHSVALGGALVTRDATLLDRFRFVRKCTGAIQTPFNAWLTIQGVKTLPVRLRHQSETARQIAEWLSGRDEVCALHYPGVGDERSVALLEEQQSGVGGAVVSFDIRGGYEAADRFVSALTLCTLAEHVGSVETLITHPASMTHADVPADARAVVGITPGLLRLSVGLEPAEDIIRDLAAGFAASQRRTSEEGAARCAASA